MFGILNLEFFLESGDYPDFWKTAVLRKAREMAGRRRIFLDPAARDLLGERRARIFLRRVSQDGRQIARTLDDLRIESEGERFIRHRKN